MKISDMFLKDIARPIQGVIKIGNDSVKTITDELKEYVVTQEMNRYFSKFFDRYRNGTQNRTDEIGVWISGFFGSGKSHFLKILSYLLGNGLYGDNKDMKAIDFFESKIADGSIIADMQVAADTSADVILFNIDAEADSDSKTNKDPIVRVFMKVFNKMQGFCGTMPWIADLERQMVKSGQYDDFRACIKELTGNNWEYFREDFYMERANIVKALSTATKMDTDAALAWYNKAEENYSLDISTFSRRVREYIEAKQQEISKKHFVVFLCDEAGQYIGDSNSLLLNLQSIVEGLGTECGGQAWVICTGQEDIDSITKVKRDLFSKALGRFKTRLNLSSANVDEVIKKRLLEKKDIAADKLRLLYEEKSAIIKNLITFSQDTPEKRLYDSVDEFIDVYPFIPYQFNLLQDVFNGIRTHGAAGKHLSEGERSLLSGFQDAAKQFADNDDGILIPFNAFYVTVETFIDHNIKKVILDAEDSANRGGALQEYDVEVLKVLFMLKYIPDNNKRLPTNLENITTIMLKHIDDDKIELKKIVDASLRRLEEQKLIIKNGDQFIFLTNEEQDINREIREIRINQSELIDTAGGVIFSVLFGLDKKYRYDERHDFGINTIIDDRPIGAQKDEMGLKILTPIYAYGGADDLEFKGMSLRERNVIVAMPSDTEFLDELEQSLQIDSFLRRNSGKAVSDTIEDIKSSKIRESKQRAARCRDLVVESLRKASIYVNGNKLEIKEKQPEQRINDALKILVDSIYTKINYINRPYLTADGLREILTAKDNQFKLDGVNDTQPNHLALAEMLDFVERSYRMNLSTTMRKLIDTFCKAEFGWKDIDIVGVAITLFRNQKIRFELNGENIATDNLNIINYVTKKDYQERLVVKWREVVDPVLLANAKDIAKEVFGRVDVPGDEDGLMRRVKDFAADELSNFNDGIIKLLEKYESARYPGKDVLEKGKKLFEELDKIKDIKAFYEYLQSEKEALIDYGEDVQDVKRFFKNQCDIYENALKMLGIYEGNRTYVLDHETIDIVAEIERITKLQIPYKEIHKLPELIEGFRNRFSKLLAEECEPIHMSIKADYDTTLHDLNRYSFADEYDASVRSEFDALLEKLSHANNISEIIGMKTESDRMKQRYIEIFIDKSNSCVSEKEVDNKAKPKRKIKPVSAKSLFPASTQISSGEEIDSLLGEVRVKIESQLEENTTIQIV